MGLNGIVFSFGQREYGLSVEPFYTFMFSELFRQKVVLFLIAGITSRNDVQDIAAIVCFVRQTRFTTFRQRDRYKVVSCGCILAAVPTQMIGFGEHTHTLILADTSTLAHSTSTCAAIVLRPRLRARVTR
jgi:hypothetical protein